MWIKAKPDIYRVFATLCGFFVLGISSAYAHHPELVLDDCWISKDIDALADEADSVKTELSAIVLQGVPRETVLTGLETVGISEEPIELGSMVVKLVGDHEEAPHIVSEVSTRCFFEEDVWPFRSCYPTEEGDGAAKERLHGVMVYNRTGSTEFLVNFQEIQLPDGRLLQTQERPIAFELASDELCEGLN